MDDSGPSAAPGLLSVLRSHVLLIVGCGLLASLVVFAGFELRTPKYQATSEVFFRSTNLDAAVLNGSSFFTQQEDPGRQAATNLELVGTPAVADRVAAKLGGRISRDELLDVMTFAQRGDSDIVGISATHPDPAVAAEVANAWAAEFVAFRQETDQAQVERAIALIRSELAELRQAAPTVETEARQRDLGANLSRLRVVQSLQTGGVEFLEAAEPPGSPTGIGRSIAIVAGGLLGLLVGLGGAYITSRADRRVKRPDGMGTMLGLPTLALVPSAPTRRGGGAPSPLTASMPIEEAFKTLGVRLQFFNIDTDRRVVAVVSGNPNEGKTLVATHMAATSARAGRRTLLIDCDLRRGDAASRFSLAGQPGLVQVLTGQATIEKSLQRVSLPDPDEQDAGGTWGEGGLWVLPNGPVPPNAVQILSSAHMVGLLMECRAQFDQVILDTAPLLRVSDTEPLLGIIDGFVVVTRLGATTTDELEGLRTIIEPHRDRSLGVVVNDVSARAGSNGYGYGYGDERRGSRDREVAR